MDMDIDALDEISDERIEAAIPDRVASIRDVQVLYGALHAFGTQGTVEGIGTTPDSGDEYLGHDAIVAVDVDLRGDEPTLRNDRPVDVHYYSADRKPLLAHAEYSDGWRAVDHSITHRAGSASSIPSWTEKRLEKWPTEQGIEALAGEGEDGDSDGWIIGALQTLGADEAIIETIKKATEGEDDSEGIADTLNTDGAMVTVRVALDPDDIDRVDTTPLFDADREWHWPGEFDVFNRAMQARIRDKAGSKGGGNAVGQGVCFVFGGQGGNEEHVVGSASDPIGRGIYQTNVREKFFDLDIDNAWRSFGVSHHAAEMMRESKAFVDACRYRNWRKSPAQYRLWTLPYLRGEISAEDARWLYRTLVVQIDDAAEHDHLLDLARDDNNDEVSFSDVSPVTPIDRLWTNVVDGNGIVDESMAERLRVYVLGARIIDNNNVLVVLDEPAGSIPTAVQLANAHEDVLADLATVGSDESKPPVPLWDNWSLLDTGQFHRNRLDYCATPVYFMETCERVDSEDPNDFRYNASTQLLTGQPIKASTLLKQYAARTIEDFDPEEERPWPTGTIASQFVQLRALARAGLLTGDTGITGVTNTTMTTEDDINIDADGDIDLKQWYRTDEPDEREQFIDEFFSNHPPLDPEFDGHDDRGRRLATERRALFLLGALVAKISAYQKEKKDLGKTLAHSVESRGITRRNIEKIVGEVYHYNSVYSSEKNTPLFWKDLMGRLTDAYAQVGSADEWTLPAAEFTAWFAFGHVFGTQIPNNDDEAESESETENESGEKSAETSNSGNDTTEAPQ